MIEKSRLPWKVAIGVPVHVVTGVNCQSYASFVGLVRSIWVPAASTTTQRLRRPLPCAAGF